MLCDFVRGEKRTANRTEKLSKKLDLTPWAPNDVDLRRAVFLLWAQRRRSMSKNLNFPPYDVIGIDRKSMISATNTASR
jgi:hypothetical protein